MRIAEALRFSRARRAQHPGDDGFPITGTDFGIERLNLRQLIRVAVASIRNVEIDGDTVAWSEMPPELRRRLLRSDEWEPIDPKPAMLVVAEAASDWTGLESEDQSNSSEEDEEEDYYA